MEGRMQKLSADTCLQKNRVESKDYRGSGLLCITEMRVNAKDPTVLDGTQDGLREQIGKNPSCLIHCC